MARRNRRNPNTNYGERARNNRDYIAIVSKSKLVGIWTGDENTSKVIAAPNDRDTRLGALKLFSEVLDKIPTNDDLLDKQVAIYGLDCLINCILRPGDVVRSKEVSDEAKEMIPELIEKYNDRIYNCFLVSEKNSNATIVSEGFDWLQDMSERMVGEAMGVTYEKKTVASSATVELTPLQKQEAKLSEAYDQLDEAYDNDADEAVIEKLEAKVARLKARVAELKGEESVKAQA